MHRRVETRFVLRGAAAYPSCLPITRRSRPMAMTRREWLIAAGALPLAARAAHAVEPEPAGAQPSGPRPLPDKASFARMDVTYLDSGTQHPISLGAKAELDRYV